jgi:3-phenylpropionate/trans-cinnamate dioxygenase ferredoxin reductase component
MTEGVRRVDRRRVVIVGAGHGGATVATMMRQQGFDGGLVLLSEEATAPYQRPPLSKQLLTRDTPQPLQGRATYQENSIDLRLATSAEGVNPEAKTVRLTSGETLHYDVLILATGAAPRMIPWPGTSLSRVYQLRTFENSRSLAARLTGGARLAIIGGGWIGLEVAAAAKSGGLETVVIEREDRILARVGSPPLAEYLANLHRQHGTEVLTNSEVIRIEDRGDATVAGVVLSDGRLVSCDLVLIAIGAAPRDELARAAGLVCRDGVVVDAAGRTSDPSIFAVGDVTCRPVFGQDVTMRLESIPSAAEQARQVAAAILTAPPPPPEVPWFWSEQFGLNLQMAGIRPPGVRTIQRGDPRGNAFVLLHCVNDEVVAVESVNSPADFLAARNLIESGYGGPIEDLADPTTPLAVISGRKHVSASASPGGKSGSTVIFVTNTGNEIGVEIKQGQSVMEGALGAGIPGIIAECGGTVTCGTCHVYVEKNWLDKLPEPDEFERETLEFAYEPAENSLLSCQLIVTSELDGLRVRVPDAQG